MTPWGSEPHLVERNSIIEKLYWAEFSYGQIARQLGVTRSTVAGVLYRHVRPAPDTTSCRIDELHRKMDELISN